jgi:hypothetical protein
MIETSRYRPCCWKTPESASSQGYTMNCVHRLRSARNVLLLGWARTARAVLLDRSPESSHASRWNKQLPSPFISAWGPALPSTTSLSFQWCPRCCRFSLRRRFDASRRRVTALRRRFDTPRFRRQFLLHPSGGASTSHSGSAWVLGLDNATVDCTSALTRHSARTEHSTPR